MAVLQRCEEENEKSAIMQDSYNMRMNLLIHGLDEKQDSAGETRKDTQDIFKDFLEQALDTDLESVPIADFHGLPQRPISIKVTPNSQDQSSSS